MAYLDIILIKHLISAPETVNTDFTSEVVDISNRQDAFSVQVVYDNGNGSVDMDINLQVSSDGVNFSTMGTQNITDDTGSHIFDVEDTGTAYLRVTITVTAGSIDVQDILYKAKRLH